MISFEMTAHGRTIKVESAECDTQDWTWIEVLDNVVWPVLRAGAYQIDTDFTEQMHDIHQEYLANKLEETGHF